MKDHIKVATALAHLLDNKFNVFGLRFGIDPLLGLIPGGGDLVSMLLSLYIIWIGIKMDIPQDKLERMIRNTLLDFFIGLMPVIGDVADFVYKSNIRNLEILEQHMGNDVIEGEIVE